MHFKKNKLAFRAALISIFVGSIICLLKFAGYYITGSSAILSDALESIINVLAAAFAAYSIKVASQDADHDHLYGHGKMEYFSAGIEGALIVVAGGLILYEAISQLIVGGSVQSMDQGILLIAVSSLGNGLLGLYLLHNGKEHHSKALQADGQHVMADFYTSVGLLGGLLAVHFSGLMWLDPVIAIVMAIWIVYNGLKLLTSSFDNLMDRADPELLELTAVAMSRVRIPELIDPHRLRLRELGNRLLVDFHVIMPWYLNVEEVHEIEVTFASRLEKEIGRPIDLMMHTDPCIPENCNQCKVDSCKKRKSKPTEAADWSISGLIQDIHHPFAD